ncbi:methyl-accepting chemotaxis protein, partial [Helicobacter sp. 11S02629-2]|uniref:methyl-accepting chemotaxis protein n=1 Tax=Helicobacter sp. 11S02629-2 TaxID=1476195 RepID=UPI000BA60B93
MKSLSAKVSLLASIILIVGVIIYMVVAVVNFRSNILSFLNSGKEEMIGPAALYFDRQTDNIKDFLSKLSENVTDNDMDTDADLKAYLDNVVRFSAVDNAWVIRMSDLSVGLAIKGKETLIMKEDEYHPKAKQYYIRALKDPNDVIKTDLYKDYDGILNVTFAKAVVRDGKVVAIVGNDLPVSSIAKSLDDYNISDFSQIFIYNPDTANMIYSQDKSLVSLENEKAKNLIGKLEAGFNQVGSDTFNFKWQGKEYLGLCSLTNYYKICITTDPAEYQGTLMFSIWLLIIVGILIVVIGSLIMLFAMRYQLKPLKAIELHLTQFFAFLDHKADAPKALIIKSKDEFKIMANVINSNITNIQSSLSKDSSAVSQALEVAKTIEEGNLSIRITKNPANPQLLELKDVLNNMLDVLETKIGSNMNEIERVFDSYLRLDFSTSVLDDKGNIANKGSVERVTNALGEEIRKMLKSSLSFASLLNEEAKKLNTQITNLSTSSNAQASSLEQSATAIEEITQSMQN